MVWEGYGMYANTQTNKTKQTLNIQMTDLKLLLVQKINSYHNSH
jgi:hypothetical protein